MKSMIIRVGGHQHRSCIVLSSGQPVSNHAGDETVCLTGARLGQLRRGQLRIKGRYRAKSKPSAPPVNGFARPNDVRVKRPVRQSTKVPPLSEECTCF